MGGLTRTPNTNQYGESLTEMMDQYGLSLLNQHHDKPPQPTYVAPGMPQAGQKTATTLSVIDLILVRDKKRLRHPTKGAECQVHNISAGSDHRLVTARLNAPRHARTRQQVGVGDAHQT
jgi:hypothetical protein